MLYLKIFFLIAFGIIHCQSEGNVFEHGAFGRVHSGLTFPNPFNCNRPIGSIHTELKLDTINVSSKSYSNGDDIFVSWIPLQHSCPDDFIGVYFPTTSQITGACDYLDFEFIENNVSNISWTMINIRQQLEFRYYSRDNNCTGNYTLIGYSSTIQPTNYDEPTQIHLAFSDRIDQMFVSYVTNSNETLPRCQYGVTIDSLKDEVSGKTETYRASDMCDDKAVVIGPTSFIDAGYLHTILLSNLQPSTKYYYRVGNDQHGWSKIYQFLTRPLDLHSEVHLIAYGDMGVSPIQTGAKSTINRVLNRSLKNNVTAILHIGDISYARGTGILWESYMHQIQETAAQFPYMVGIGNHEYDHISGGSKDPSHAHGDGGFRPIWGNYGNDSGGECAVPMVHRFHSPSNGNGLFWYSFNIGSIHIIYYSTEHDFRRTSEQYRWIENDLQSVNRQETPWIIVTGHRPMYSSLTGIDLIQIMLRLAIEPLLYRYNVDLNLFAHIHSYERTCPMYQQRCVNNGITHVLIGMGGHDLTYGTYFDAKWSLYHDIQFGYTFISANKTQLKFSYYHTDNDQEPIDQFILYK